MARSARWVRNFLLLSLPPALIVFFFVFILTAVSFLRERSQGTMERLLATPASRFEIVTGYMLGFLVFALAQAALDATVAYMGERQAFGQSIDQFQALQFRLAELAGHLCQFLQSDTVLASNTAAHGNRQFQDVGPSPDQCPHD